MTVQTSDTSAALQTAFRDAMAQVASAVAVVTTLDGDRPHGTTVSAFTSLSLDPPMVAVALDRSSALLGLLRVGGPIGINVLASHHDQVALRFAGKGDDKFADIGWRLDHGAPVLPDHHAWVAGRVAELVPAGDHVLALVEALHAAEGAHAPLTYWQRTFGTHHGF